MRIVKSKRAILAIKILENPPSAKRILSVEMESWTLVNNVTMAREKDARDA